MRLPNFRKVEHIKVVRVVVAEGLGTEKSPIREVVYYFDENDFPLWKYDPCPEEAQEDE